MVAEATVAEAEAEEGTGVQEELQAEEGTGVQEEAEAEVEVDSVVEVEGVTVEAMGEAVVGIMKEGNEDLFMSC